MFLVTWDSSSDNSSWDPLCRCALKGAGEPIKQTTSPQEWSGSSRRSRRTARPTLTCPLTRPGLRYVAYSVETRANVSFISLNWSTVWWVNCGDIFHQLAARPNNLLGRYKIRPWTTTLTRVDIKWIKWRTIEPHIYYSYRNAYWCSVFFMINLNLKIGFFDT